MEKAITISVTVPVHNTAPYLPKCLDSLLAQTYPHLEIICVDDGSTDNSLQILNDYAARDSRIKVFHQEAQGVSAARNTALLHSSGDFVTSLDSDDYIKPDLYEQAAAMIAPDIDMVCFGMQLVDIEDRELANEDGYFMLGYEGVLSFSEAMSEKINVCICSKLWRKSIIDDNHIQFPVGLVHEDDALFYMFCPFVRKAAFLPFPGYCYVQRRGSIMHDDRKTIADAEQYLGILRYVHGFYQRRGHTIPQNNYFLRQFGRVYYLVERFCPPHQRSQLAEMFRTLAQETGLAAAHPRDWRLRCLNLPGRFLSYFIRRRSRSTQYRLGPVPLCSLHYAPDAATPCLRFDLIHALYGHLRRFSIRRKQVC